MCWWGAGWLTTLICETAVYLRDLQLQRWGSGWRLNGCGVHGVCGTCQHWLCLSRSQNHCSVEEWGQRETVSSLWQDEFIYWWAHYKSQKVRSTPPPTPPPPLGTCSQHRSKAVSLHFAVTFSYQDNWPSTSQFAHLSPFRSVNEEKLLSDLCSWFLSTQSANKSAPVPLHLH